MSTMSRYAFLLHLQPKLSRLENNLPISSTAGVQTVATRGSFFVLTGCLILCYFLVRNVSLPYLYDILKHRNKRCSMNGQKWDQIKNFYYAKFLSRSFYNYWELVVCILLFLLFEWSVTCFHLYFLAVWLHFMNYIIIWNVNVNFFPYFESC